MEPSKNFEEFCDRVCAQVQYVPARDAIRRELLGHMEDHAAVLQELGVPEEEAMQEAVAAMGDASEIGRELNEQHKPFWGRLLLGLRIALVILSVVIIIIASMTEYSDVWNIGHHFYYRDTLNLKYVEGPYQKIELDTWRNFAGFHVHIDGAYLVQTSYRISDNNEDKDAYGTAYTLCLSGTFYQKSLLQQSNMHFSDPSLAAVPVATDDLGNTYYSHSPFAFGFIDPQATEILIDYEYFGDRFAVVVPLEQAWEELQ